jgi:Secretion system C-terminal sorting domain/PKD-like domain
VWTVPSTWTIQSGQGTSSITVLPPYTNTASSNDINCRVFRRASPLQSNKLGFIDVTRFYPTHNITAIPNAINNICPNETHTYSVNTNCGVSAHVWTVPSGWTIQSGQNTNTMIAFTGLNPQSGNVNVAVNYTSGVCNMSDVQPVEAITAAPIRPLVQNRPNDFDYIYFHCNRWWFCANNSKNYLTGNFYDDTETVNWQISAPWLFRLPNGSTTRNITWNVNYTQTTPFLSPAISCANGGVGTSGGGSVTITAGNCIGSNVVVQPFSRELSTFCQGNTSCYPATCACCLGTSGCTQNPLRPDVEPQAFSVVDDIIYDDTEISENENYEDEMLSDKQVTMWVNDLVEIYPNPNTGIFYVQSKETIEQIRVLDAQGRLIYEQNNPNTQIEINLNQQPNGIYWLQSIAKGSTKTSKVVIAR